MTFAEIARAIPRGLSRVATFSGREARGPFIAYGAAVIAVLAFGFMAVVIPLMARAMTAMQAYAAEHPEQATVVSGPTSYSITIEDPPPGLMPDVTPILTATQIGMLLAVVLLAAAVVRRLHDRGRSGLWGLLPLPFMAYGAIMMPRVIGPAFQGQEPDLGQFFALFANNVAYLGALALLGFLLIGESTPGPNRYGEAPRD